MASSANVTSAGASRSWLFVYLALFLAAYSFSRPVARTKRHVYAMVCYCLNIWLAAISIYHLPLVRHVVGFDLQAPVSLFLPLFAMTGITLGGIRMWTQLVLQRSVDTKDAADTAFSSALVSAGCCAVHAWSGGSIIHGSIVAKQWIAESAPVLFALQHLEARVPAEILNSLELTPLVMLWVLALVLHMLRNAYTQWVQRGARSCVGGEDDEADGTTGRPARRPEDVDGEVARPAFFSFYF